MPMENFEWLPDEENSRYVDEQYALLKQLEEEYQWTQDLDTKEKMIAIAYGINDMLTSNLIHKY